MEGKWKTTETGKIELVYTIFCDDVRLEVGNKLTVVGIFHALFVPQMPVTLIKFAVLNHWRGEGQHMSEVRILTPDRSKAIVASHPGSFQIPVNGFADNVTIFANVNFPAQGDYIVQTLIDSTLYAEQTLMVGVVEQGISGSVVSESIN
ncbi:MAG: hypothetical protein HY650_15940 [Acidobacteria bacterium]|nr:hypothetical protein [Acidobacteriota bacterium]